MTLSTEQVAIDMDNMTNTNKQMDKLSATGTNMVNGSYSKRLIVHRRHNSHGSNESGMHRNNHNHSQSQSGESDVEDRSRHQHQNNNHRQRRRSKSRSNSRSNSAVREKRTTTDVPSTEKDHRTNSHDVEPLLIPHINRNVQHERDDHHRHEHKNGHRHDTSDTDSNQPNGTDRNHQFHQFLDANGDPQVIPDINVYQQKKNLAQGMMDLALLSANANQLRYVLETYVRHPYFWFSLAFIVTSLILQVAVGVGLIMNSRCNVKNREQRCRADKINNITILGIFLITTVNVFIAAFGVADPPAAA